MTRNEWADVCDWMRNAWPNFNVPSHSLGLWYNALQHHSVGEVQAAAESWFAAGKEFPPNGSVLMGLIREAAEARRGTRPALLDPAGCRHPDPHAWLSDGTVMCRLCREELGVRAE